MMENKTILELADKAGFNAPELEKGFANLLRQRLIDFANLVEAHERLAQPEPEPVAIGGDWRPCVKLPIVVHVREQRKGETHVSTREGITPVREDDLIMRGVAGEEYPIGRELFNRTYTFDTAPLKREWIGLTDEDRESILDWSKADKWNAEQMMAVVEARLKEKNHG